MDPDVRRDTDQRGARHDDLPDAGLFWRWVGSATRPVVGWVLIGLGVLLILAGYLGVSREALVAKQIPYLVSGGIFGMVLVAVGAFLLGTEDLRKDLRRLDRLEEMVGDLHGALLTRLSTDSRRGGAANGSRPSGNGRAASGLVALPRGRSYHRAECSMVEGKDVAAVSLREVDERGLDACSLCEPEPVHA
jgi:hypothetical protein